MKRILLIEDDYDIAANIQDFLEAARFEVTYASNGALGLHFALESTFDLVILDIRMPGINGLSVCEQLRNGLGLDWPVLMLTAADALPDRLKGFRAGADDYVVKPFELEELLARIRALIRRAGGTKVSSTISVGDLVLDVGRRQATRSGCTLELTNTGFQIIRHLCENYPNVVPREDIEKKLWPDEPPHSDALRSHIFALRTALDKPFEQPMLKTLRGVGYQLTL